MPLSSKYPDVDIPNQTLFDYIFGDIKPEHINKVAIQDSGTKVTYGELRRDIELFAGALAHRGIGKGDVVALHCPNSTTFAVAFHGILRANATVTTVASLATAEDVEKQLKIAKAKAILTTSSIGWAGHKGAELAGLDSDLILGLTGLHGISEMLAEGHAAPEQDISPAEDIAVVPFSSGTTGLPKGVMLSHRNLVANLAQTEPLSKKFISDSTRAVTPLPFFHIYGMNVLMNHLLANRAYQITMPKFDFVEFLRLMQDSKANFAFIAPPIAVALAKHSIVDQFDLSALETILSGAASLQVDLGNQVSDRLGCFVTQGFGMTELSPVSHLRVDDSVPVDSIGQATPNTEYMVADIESEDLAEIRVPEQGRSKAGELWIRGPQVMLGYFGNPEATAACFSDDWFRTGDIAELDEEGNVFIVDRLKELIKYKGYQVAPAELEDILLNHPAVADAACVGVLDNNGEEVPKAFVVRAQGSEIAAEELMEYVSDRVAPYKRIRAVEFIDAIPKSATGKILRRNLKQY